MVSTMERRSREHDRSLLSVAAAVAALAASALVSGCSAGSGEQSPGTPSRSVSASRTASASVSPTIAAPVLPEAAKQPTRPGAEAFFRYFIASYNYAFEAQDTVHLRMITASGCKFCASAVDAIESARAEGRYTDGGQVTPSVVTVAPGEPAEGLVINAVVDQEPSRLLDRSGTVVRSEPAYSQVRMDASAAWVDSAWQMRAVHIYAKTQK